jgi:CubicO group peptidase (beta-lactamase class C family)
MPRIQISSAIPIALVLTLLLGGCGGPAATPTVQADLPSSVQERIQRVENGLIAVTADRELELGHPKTLAERMEHYGVPGVSIAVINDYQVEWARGYGVLEAGANDRVTPDSLFNAGSIAKPVSAAAALALVERGLLDLDEDVNNKLVSWHVPENEYTTEEKVTLRRLLSHSSGLTDGFPMRSSSDPEFDWWSAAGEAPTVTIQQLLEAQPPADEGRPARVTRVPGAAYQYSNLGYGVVQLLMTDVRHQPFSELMQEAVLGPLGMTSSTFEQPLPEDLRDGATTEHYVNGQPFEGKRHHYPIQASGGLWTTPSDLARFAIEIMRARAGESELLLSQEMASEMLTPQIEADESFLGDSYGLGFDLADSGREFRFAHSGGTWGSACLLWVHPETGQGAVIMTNSASGEGAIRIEILLSIAAEYGWPLQLAGNRGNYPDLELALDRTLLLQGRDSQLEAAITYLDQATIPQGCTVFTVSKGDRVFFGGNNDWIDPDSTYWVDPGGVTGYGTIWIGTPDNVQQGMNEKANAIL